MKLRAVRSSDGDALHAIFTQAGVRQFLFDDVLLSREQTQLHVDAATTHDAWAICDGSEVVGLVSLRPTAADVELTIVVGEQCWGKGVAYDAACQALRHGFEIGMRPRILATVDLPNERSHRLMLRLGFKPTGEGQGPTYRHRTYEALRRSGT